MKKIKIIMITPCSENPCWNLYVFNHLFFDTSKYIYFNTVWISSVSWFSLDIRLLIYSVVTKYSLKFLFFTVPIQWMSQYLFIQLTIVEHVACFQLVNVVMLLRTSLNIYLYIHTRFFIKKIIWRGINWLKFLRLFICILNISPGRLYSSSTWRFISSYSNNTRNFL